jgi:PAS domain S-box-containing protein
MSANNASALHPTMSLVRRLFPSLIILVLLPLIAAAALLWYQHQDRMAELIAEDADELTTDLQMILDLQGAGIAAAVQPIAADAGVQEALARSTADGLLATWQPVFATMRRTNHITHLYFLDRNRTCLLRVHAPGQAGDRIDRFTAREAERTGQAASGLELGPRGTLTLRVVQPVIVNGHLLGYVELGKEVEDVLGKLRSHMEEWNQMAVIIHKDRLDRKAWESTQVALGREPEWDRMVHHVVILASQGHLPDSFLAWVDPVRNPSRPHQGETEISENDALWRIMAAPLRDASGAEIGDIIAMRNISGDRSTLIWQLALGGSAALLMLALVLTLVHRLLAKADRRIVTQQASLRDERWRLGSIIEATRAGTWEWNISGGTILVSERWAQILGQTRLELGAFSRESWERLLHPDDVQTARDLLRRHFAGELPFIDHECRMKHKDGHWVWIHCRGRVFTHTEAGEPLLMFGTHSDVTARKLAEEEHIKLQQLKMARELGEMVHANRLVALGTLMAGLAHEFNHPAQVVMMNQKSLRSMVEACAATARDLEGPAVGLLSWKEVGTIAPQLLDDMELATTQLSELIENVQNYARPSEGLCHVIDYDMLTSVSRSSLRLVASYARRCQVALIDEVDPASEMHSGCSCLQQIVVNLLINAIQASRPGDSVAITCQRDDGRISLSVRDSGQGIDAAVLEKLGQPFVTTKKAQGGNGLGLFICMQIVAEQGGRLELTPRRPHGTMARVVYPDTNPA